MNINNWTVEEFYSRAQEVAQNYGETLNLEEPTASAIRVKMMPLLVKNEAHTTEFGRVVLLSMTDDEIELALSGFKRRDTLSKLWIGVAKFLAANKDFDRALGAVSHIEEDYRAEAMVPLVDEAINQGDFAQARAVVERMPNVYPATGHVDLVRPAQEKRLQDLQKI